MRNNRLTVDIVLGAHEPGRDGQEQNPLFAVFRIVLGHGGVDGCFANCVWGGDVDFELVDEVQVGHASRESNNFFGFALEDERHVRAEEVDVSNHVDLKRVEEVLLEPGRVLGPWTCQV